MQDSSEKVNLNSGHSGSCLLACLPEMGLVEGLMTHNLFLKKGTRIPRGVGTSSAESGKKSQFGMWEDHMG